MNRHRVDAISLAFGLIFLTVGAVFVSGGVDAADLGTAWIAPSILVAAGLVIGAVAWHRSPPSSVETLEMPESPDTEG